MPLTLHAALIPGWLQTLGAVSGLLGKAEAHCAQHGLAPADLIEARLIGDMNAFSYQVKSCMVHSRYAIEGVRVGTCSPDFSKPPATFDGLREQVDATLAFLEALDPQELDSLIGRPVVFEIQDIMRREFTAETFLLTFSQPNFFFHAATAYDILRMNGVQIGKGNFLGTGEQWRRP
jgi:uncharacterized protein